MRVFLAVLICLALTGCGGGNVRPPSDLTGAWTGRVDGLRQGALEVQVLQQGETLSGDVRLTLDGVVYSGPFTGRCIGNRIEAEALLDNSYGKVYYSGDVDGDRILGTYLRPGFPLSERGSVHLDRSPAERSTL